MLFLMWLLDEATRCCHPGGYFRRAFTQRTPRQPLSTQSAWWAPAFHSPPPLQLHRPTYFFTHLPPRFPFPCCTIPNCRRTLFPSPSPIPPGAAGAVAAGLGVSAHPDPTQALEAAGRQSRAPHQLLLEQTLLTDFQTPVPVCEGRAAVPLPGAPRVDLVA